MSEPIDSAAWNNAAQKLVETLVSGEVCRLLGLNVAEERQAAVDAALADLIFVAGELTDMIGAQYAREALTRVFLERAEKTPAVLAAALIRLAGRR